MKTSKKWAAALSTVVLGIALTGLVPLAANAAQAEAGHPIPDQFCPDVLIKAAYNDPDVLIKAAYNDPDVVTPAVPGEFVNYNWNGGNTDTAPAFPGEGWHKNNGNHNGHPDPVDGLTYDQGKNDGGNASWFHWALEGAHPAVTTPGAHHDAVYGPGQHHDAVYEEGPCSVWVTWESPVYHADLNGHVDAPSDIWNQTFVSFGQTAPNSCTTYQQDKYEGSRADIEAVLADSILTGPPSPYEDGGIVKDWTFVSTGNCEVPLPQDAGANIVVSPANCTVTGLPVGISGANATLNGGLEGLDQTVGTHTATFTAVAGHLFSNGTNTLTVEYTIADKDLTGSDCPQDAGANIVTHEPTCSADGDAFGISGTFATLDGGLEGLDESVGVHWANFTAVPGHLFSNGTAHLAVSYEVKAQLPTSRDCPVVYVAPNMDPNPGTCAAPGSFDVPVGAVQNEWNVNAYSLDGGNITLLVDRSVPGVVNLYVFSPDGSRLLSGLSDAWTVNADGRSALRTITLDGQLTGPDCQVAPPQPPALTGNDESAVSECVTPLDGTSTVVTTTTPWTQEYVWVADAEAVDGGTWVLGNKVPGEPVVTSAVVDDEGCAPAVVPPVDEPPVSKPPVETPPSLSQTGFDGLGGLYASIAFMLAGAGLLVTRRLVRR